MDIIESEMGYLGFYETEAYGISWKVREEIISSRAPVDFGSMMSALSRVPKWPHF